MISRYKLMNILRKDLIKHCQCHPKDVETKYLKRKEIFNLIDSFKYIEVQHKFYEIWENDYNWIDVEGEGYGWIWCGHPQEEFHELIVDFAKKQTIYAEKQLKNKKIIIGKNDEFVIIIFPMRDIEKFDIVITLSNEEIDF